MNEIQSFQDAVVRHARTSLGQDPDDTYFLLADWIAYRATRRRAAETWLDQRGWTRAAVLGIARSGYFSSERAIAEYAKEIWSVGP